MSSAGQIAPGEQPTLILGLRLATGATTGTFGGFDLAYSEAGRIHHVTSAQDIMIASDLSAREAWVAR